MKTSREKALKFTNAERMSLEKKTENLNDSKNGTLETFL